MLGANLIEDAVVGPGLHESCSQGIYVIFLLYTEGLVYFIIGNNEKNYTIISQFTARMCVRRGRLP
jgi:hypothetical protein